MEEEEFFSDSGDDDSDCFDYDNGKPELWGRNFLPVVKAEFLLATILVIESINQGILY